MNRLRGRSVLRAYVSVKATFKTGKIMHTRARQTIFEGAALGLIAGIIFGTMQIVGAVAMGDPPLLPLRMFASVALGQAALETTSVPTVLIVGNLVHLLLSALFGIVYVKLNERRAVPTHRDFTQHASMGLLFGAALYLVIFQGFARFLYPWFLEAPQMTQLIMHALFFGLPLGLTYTVFERRLGHRRPALRRRHAHAGR